MTAIVGWDNPSSYAIAGAKVAWATCWSELQKRELVLGSDWQPARVHVGGMPAYDGYLNKAWQMSREDYFRLHNLDPSRKLISYATVLCTCARIIPTSRHWPEWSPAVR
jgi:hypothetical protein